MRRALCPQLYQQGAVLSLRALQALSAAHLNARCASWKLWRSEVDEWYEEQHGDRCSGQETDDEDEPDDEEMELRNTNTPHATSSTRCDVPCLASSREDEEADAIEMHEWYEEQCEHDAERPSRWQASGLSLRLLLHARSVQRGCCCCGAPD